MTKLNAFAEDKLNGVKNHTLKDLVGGFICLRTNTWLETAGLGLTFSLPKKKCIFSMAKIQPYEKDFWATYLEKGIIDNE